MCSALWRGKRRPLGYGQDSSTLLPTSELGNWEAAKLLEINRSQYAATLKSGMNANDFGKRLGIGVRIAGRIAQQRAQQNAAQSPTTNTAAPGAQTSQTVYDRARQAVPNAQNIRQAKQKTHQYTRAAGRGVGGFLKPFTRVGGILWLEVTGFFFGLFTLYFAQDIWKVRAGYATGPLHMHFLISSIAAAVFAYLSVSAFWRARRR
jgi:hypothetical protein